MEIKKIKLCCIKKCGFHENCCEYEFKDRDGRGLLPGKINILYAFNGYGKTTLANALKLVQDSKQKLNIDRDSEDTLIHQLDDRCKEDKKVEIAITYNIGRREVTVISSRERNEIRQSFEVFVINNHVFVKAIRRYQRGAKGKLEIKNIQIIDSIPRNVENELFKDMKSLSNECNINRRKIINFFNKNLNSIKSYIELYDKYRVDQFNKLKKENVGKSEEFYCLFHVYKKRKKLFNEYLYFKKYKRFMEFAKKLINDVKSFKFDVKFKKGVLEFPFRAEIISNGQRDVMVFLASILKVFWQMETVEKPFILVIDEVFDYLDDANTLIAQYFLVKLIKEYKREKEIFTLLLTHLSPITFRNFLLNKRIKKDFFLMKMPKINEQIVNLVKERNRSQDDRNKYNGLSKLLHFNNNKEYEFEGKKYNEIVSILEKEFEKYQLGEDYCPVSVSVFLRIKIEEKAYSLLRNEEDKSNFFDLCKTTQKKLEFVEEVLEEDLPEKWYLLGALYNEMAHNENNEFLYYKLENIIIKNLIIRTVNEN